jgi:hypothetical protein
LPSTRANTGWTNYLVSGFTTTAQRCDLVVLDAVRRHVVRASAFCRERSRGGIEKWFSIRGHLFVAERPDHSAGEDLLNEQVLIDQELAALLGAKAAKGFRACRVDVQPGRDRQDELHKRQFPDPVLMSPRPIETESHEISGLGDIRGDWVKALTQLLRRPSDLVLALVHDDDGCALRSETLRRGKAEAARRAGDDCGPPFQPGHFDFSCSLVPGRRLVFRL